MKDLPITRGRLFVLLLAVAFCAYLLSLAITVGAYRSGELASRAVWAGLVLGYLVSVVAKKADLRPRVALGVASVALALLGAAVLLYFGHLKPPSDVRLGFAFAGVQALLSVLWMSAEGPLIHPMMVTIPLLPPALILLLDDPMYGLSLMPFALVAAVILTARSMFEKRSQLTHYRSS